MFYVSVMQCQKTWGFNKKCKFSFPQPLIARKQNRWAIFQWQRPTFFSLFRCYLYYVFNCETKNRRQILINFWPPERLLTSTPLIKIGSDRHNLWRKQKEKDFKFIFSFVLMLIVNFQKCGGSRGHCKRISWEAYI